MRAPRDVVAIQLSALQNNDVPTPDAGIAQTFALAHPDNQRATGPLQRFAMMIRSPAYRPLIGHSSHTIEPLGSDARTARFSVIIETPDGKALNYYWELRRVTEGPAKGAWLTSAVSAPASAGQPL